MKNCPFCKNEIEASAEQCPICKRTLIERFPSTPVVSKRVPTPSPGKTSEERTYAYTTPKTSPAPKKQFQLPKGSGWLISIIGSIVLTMIFSGSHSSSNPLPPPLPAPITVADSEPTAPTLTPHAPYRSLTNGTVIFSSPASFNGEGILSISNGSGSDAVVKLITNNGRKVYSVYVRANDSYSIENISDGVYRVLFSFGSDWDPDQKKFLVNPSAEAFEDTFDFEPSDIQYTKYSITLNPVLNGKAATSPLDPSVFDKY